MLDDRLVAIRDTNLLRIEPIWTFPIDEIEGPLYQQYILKNPGYKDIYVREPLSEMLAVAAMRMPKKYQLIIRAGHRPLAVQLKLLEMVKQKYRANNPDATGVQALEFARTYVSDPTIKLPPHCCGAAVDVDVKDTLTGELVDFGCPVNTDSDIAFLDSDEITQSQKINRNMLLDAMLSAGFAPFAHEWWHFSFGDAIWKDFYKKKNILYGLIEPDLDR